MKYILLLLPILFINCKKIDSNKGELSESKNTIEQKAESTSQLKIINTSDIPINEQIIEFNYSGKVHILVFFKNYFYALAYLENSINSSSYSTNPILKPIRIDLKGNVKEFTLENSFLQDYNYEFIIENDELYLVKTRDGKSFHLKNNKWVESKFFKEKKLYEDNNITVYSEDFGEWGGLTWIKDKNSNNEFEIKGDWLGFHIIKSEYYLINKSSIYSISTLENLKKAKISYAEYLKKGMNIYNGNGTLDGLKLRYKSESYNPYSNDFSFVNSFLYQEVLYLLYRENEKSFIGILAKDSLKSVIEFQNFQWASSELNVKNVNSKNKAGQYSTLFPQLTGYIEFSDSEITLYNLINSHHQTEYSEARMTQWIQLEIDRNLRLLNTNSLKEAIQNEQILESINITTRDGLNKAELDEIKHYDRRKIYRKKQENSINIISEYFYDEGTQNIGAVSYTWEAKSNNITREFLNWFQYLSMKFGEPTKVDETEYRSIYIWELENKKGIRVSENSKVMSIMLYSR